MPEFFIDGEPLCLATASPPSLDALLAVVEPLLAGRERVLADVRIDGKPPDEGSAPSIWLTAGRIDVISLSVAEAVARLVAELFSRIAELLPEIDALACSVLRKAWDEAAGECLTAATRLGEVVRDIEALVERVPGVAGPASQTARALHAWVEAIEARDAAAVCLVLDRRVLAALSTLRDALKAADGHL